MIQTKLVYIDTTLIYRLFKFSKNYITNFYKILHYISNLRKQINEMHLKINLIYLRRTKNCCSSTSKVTTTQYISQKNYNPIYTKNKQVNLSDFCTLNFLYN